ncbi:hypothetical protein MNEG_12292 [Monoraphidium neglectum]|uniref:Homeobox domain-containing protein n=1 Tax=Monoraphidium neglectum TaxID=145388 RepID=A0A0D2M2Z2_9CHLO|nr:hypothetical protein MNEG_12292 [Monoraphidium neglectum]KIY95671.1 hypothetical protein MNEG_12292 [Monoraphidium neglectum]|eukprot:XP_013894691.1 hypothetical protein MNEG_12292 [Monoraphidium neglectum]
MDGDDGGAPTGKTPAKPRQKTPLQKEVLEASYMINQNPTPDHCRALAQRIQLTEKEVRDWFSGRRRRVRKKEQKAAEAAGGGGASPPPGAAASGAAAAYAGTPQPPSRQPSTGAHGSGGGGGAPASAAAASPGAASGWQHHHQQQPWEADPLAGLTADEEAQLLELARQQLPQPLREDGPPLALRFDPPPPGANVGPAPTAAAGKRRAEGQAGPDGKRSRGGSVDGARTPVHESEGADWAAAAAAGGERGWAARAEAEARVAELEEQALQLQQLLESCADEAEAGRLRAELAQRQVALEEQRTLLAAPAPAADGAADRLAQQRAREVERQRATQ